MWDVNGGCTGDSAEKQRVASDGRHGEEWGRAENAVNAVNAGS